MSCELTVKELRLEKDVVLLVSDGAGDDKRLHSARRERNEVLAAMLLNCGLGGRSGLREQTCVTMHDVQLVGGFLGKPELLVRGRRGPSVSFSHALEVTWAALCLSEGAVGIDATDPGEFAGDYPFHRVFHTLERGMAEEIAADDCLEAAALLWSAKEAVVKALGCGFHLLDPLDVRILPEGSSSGIAKARVAFSDRIRARFQVLRTATVRVACFREESVWVSIAVSSWTTALQAHQP